MKQRRTTATRDYGDLFLVMTLVGIVMVVLGLMMAVAHSNARPVTFTSGFIKDVSPKGRAAVKYDGGISRGEVEPNRFGPISVIPFR